MATADLFNTLTQFNKTNNNLLINDNKATEKNDQIWY